MTAERDTATAEADTAALREFIARLDAAMAACETLADPELARHTGRKLLAVVSCTADALLRDGGAALQAAPDKFGAFFDKAAAGYVQAIEGLHKRAVLTEAADVFAAGGSRAADPRLGDYALWGPPKAS